MSSSSAVNENIIMQRVCTFVCSYLQQKRSLYVCGSEIGIRFLYLSLKHQDQVMEGSHLPFSLSHFPNLIDAECTQEGIRLAAILPP